MWTFSRNYLGDIAVINKRFVRFKVCTKTLLVLGFYLFIPLDLKWDVLCAQELTADTIKSVRVTGNQRIENETIVSYLRTRIGDPFDSVLIDESLRALFGTGLFADVRMVREEGTLIVQVVENPIL